MEGKTKSNQRNFNNILDDKIEELFSSGGERCAQVSGSNVVPVFISSLVCCDVSSSVIHLRSPERKEEGKMPKGRDV